MYFNQTASSLFCNQIKLTSLAQNLWLAILTLLSVCFKGEAFVPYYTGQVLDSIVVKQDFTHFKSNAWHFILAHFMSGMLGGVRTCMFTIGVSRLNVRLRRLVFGALIDQDIGFFDKVKTGDMLSRLSADTTTMSDLISQNLNGFLWNFVKTSKTSSLNTDRF